MISEEVKLIKFECIINDTWKRYFYIICSSYVKDQDNLLKCFLG